MKYHLSTTTKEEDQSLQKQRESSTWVHFYLWKFYISFTSPILAPGQSEAMLYTQNGLLSRFSEHSYHFGAQSAGG